MFNALNLPLWHLTMFDVFSSNLTKFSVMIENQCPAAFHANQSLDSPMNAHGFEQNVIFFGFPPQIQVYFSLIQKIRNMKCVLGTHFQPFNIQLISVCNLYEKFWI